MKYFTKLATLVAIALLASLQSCNKQSVLNVEDFTDKATITGVISIVSYTKEGENRLPAAGKTVVVEVQKSDYCKKAVGVEKFFAVTDEYGNFSIEVPVTKVGVTATVYAESFVVDTTMTVTELNRLFDYVVENAVFTDARKTSFSLHPADHYFYDGLYTINAQDCYLNDELIDVVLKGQLNYVGWYAVNPGYTTRYLPCQEVNFDVKLTRYDSDGSEIDTRVFRGVTKDDGYFELNVQIPANYNFDYNFELSVNHLVDDFEHHYYNNLTSEWETQKVQAYYYTESPYVKTPSSESIAITHFVDLGINLVSTRPFDKEIVRGIGNPDLDKDKSGNTIYSNGSPLGWKY